MKKNENEDVETIEATGERLRDFESALTTDLSELRQDINAFKADRHVRKTVELANMLKRWVGRHPSVQPARLDEIISLARDVITQKNPSERMVEQRVREAIDAAVARLRDGAQNRKKATGVPRVFCAESKKIFAGAPEEVATLRARKEPKDKITEYFVTLGSRLLEAEKKVALKRLLDDLVPDVERRIKDRVKATAENEARKKKEAKKTQTGEVPIDEPEATFEPAMIASFYVHYAVFTEYFKSMKLLYQVLLKEYEELELLDDGVVLNIRGTAIKMIATRLAEGRWKGPEGAANRAEFRNSMLKEIRQNIHRREHGQDAQPPIAALCLSGGGIRSATFSLGVIQALAKHRLLAKFDYLSTVSGGGYIGGWLSAWIFRSGKSVENVERILVERNLGEVEPTQVTHLRSYSNYMSPRLGLGSADTWTLIGVYLRNLLLNWTVVIPLAASILLLPRILAEVVAHGGDWVGEAPSIPAFAVLAVAEILAILAAFSSTVFRPSLAKNLKKSKWFSQAYRRDDIGMLVSAESKIVTWCVLPMVLFAILVTTYWAWGTSGERLTTLQSFLETIRKSESAIPIFIGIAVVFAAALIFNLTYRRSERGEKSWDLIFSSLLFLACIGIAGLQTTWLAENPLLFGMVAFADLIFIGGFIPARAYVWLRSDEKTRPRAIENIAHEFSIAFLAASLGGMLLFAGQHAVLEVSRWLNNDELAADVYTVVAVPAFLIVYLLSGTLFVGVGSKLLDDGDREWLSRVGAWLLLLAAAWLAIFSLVLLAPLGLKALLDVSYLGSSALASLGGLSGLVTLLFGFFARSLPEEKTAGPKKKSRLAELLPKVAAPIFAAFLVVLLVIGTDGLMYLVGTRIEWLSIANGHAGGQAVAALLLWCVGFGAVGSFMGLWVNINKFSLHAIYRDRIMRAYLGASRGFERLNSANSFTGLDDNDNLDMVELAEQRPFHVVNMTLNLTRSANLRWQNRKAESFTITPFHSGSSNMGEGSGNYRASKLYGADKFKRPITLGTAIAISGAAASPNMGYFTQSAPVSALMALFNVRLGWWLGNPGGRGRKTYYKNAPDFAPIPMAGEAFGRTADTNSYVYLSDGGHFENLGLYEMVLRRCKFIVLCDAGADPSFAYSDLAIAIHKIRVDMGVPIEFEDGRAPICGRYCAIGKIRYPAIDGEAASNGVLVYLKPTLDDKEPIDIANYKKKAPNFPHESTADQMYSETQFESYRQLGFHMMNAICGAEHPDPCDRCGDLATLRSNAQGYIQRGSPAATKKRRPPRLVR